MNAYQTALKAYLARDDVRQDDVAAKINKSQAALSRYATGKRFPDAETARAIDAATSGEVAFDLWKSVQLARLGLAA